MSYLLTHLLSKSFVKVGISGYPKGEDFPYRFCLKALAPNNTSPD